MSILQKSKKKDMSVEEKDVKEFYAKKQAHKVRSLKKLIDELDRGSLALWQFEYTSKFVKQYKKLSKILQSRVKQVLDELANSDNPLKLGKYKKHLKAFTYNLDNHNRLLYNVRFPDNIIELIRVGDHKEVYGAD